MASRRCGSADALGEVEPLRVNISGPRIILPSDTDSAADEAKHGAMVEMCLFQEHKLKGV